MTLIIVKTWSRLLISNYAWHLPGSCGLPFSCLLLGRVIEDHCLPLPGKGGTWHTSGLLVPFCAWRPAAFQRKETEGSSPASGQTQGRATEQGALCQTILLLLSLFYHHICFTEKEPEPRAANGEQRPLGMLPAFPLLENWELRPWAKKQENLM